ncbi:MAG: recombinase family protein [Clostridiales bacterium]|jgi:DNA invertase Pin-like site-specific DNA recombinase|nr:recombinase family protein [Clostridiales bacterium]
MNNIFVNDTHAESYISNPSNVRAAVYCRLSKDDGDYDSDSSSIQTQRAMLEHYCTQQGWEIVAVFQDDGFTGLNMNRPDLQRMLKAVERRQIDVIVTKDLSRLSRNYIEVGQLMEETFPRNSVRYIAINDAVDSDREGAYDMTPFRAVMNQMYSADVSKKVHSAYVTKARSGQFTGCLAPFGYRKSPDDHNLLIPDEETAWIVKAIFDYAREGKGPNAIRRKLEDAEIPTPTWWNRQKGLRDKTTKFERENPETGRFIWDFTTIKEILSNPVYIGAIASQKTVYKFKTGWIKDKKPHEWMIAEDMHEPLISREIFGLVQEKVRSRQRPDAFGNYSIFAGIIKCGQCGATMNVRRANQKGNERIYTCARYNKYGVKHCSQHRIKYDVLYGIILEQIRSYAVKALEDENEVLKQLARQSKNDYSDERSIVEKGIAEDTARLVTLDKLIAKLYEDMVADRISSDNFNAILAKSQSEQKALRDRLQLSKSRLNDNKQEQDDTSRWIELIKEYADIRELDSATLQRLIKKIVIHEDTDGGTVRQTVEIHFNFMSQPDKCKLIRE